MKMDEIQGKSVAQKLKSEYTVKSSCLSELKEQITTIKREILRMLGQKSREECQKRLEVTSLVEAVEWRKKLHQLTSQLQNVHLDDSTEHRSLKQLQRYIQMSLLSGPQLDTEVYELVACVADLNLIHGNLCEAKEEMENEINTALRILAKALLHITAEYDPSIEGNCTDYMAHFVKQHVSPRRRKVPFGDLTNRIVPSAPQPEGADITDFPHQDSTDISTDYATNKLSLLKNQESRNICSHSSRDMLSIDKQNVHLQEKREKDKENRHLPHTSSGDHRNHLSTNHHRTREECAATHSRMNCKQGADKDKGIENSLSVSEVTQGFSVRSRARTEPGIGMECRLHGRSGGKIKLSHFSTPSKGVFTPIAENRHHFSYPSKAVISPPRIESAYDRDQIQVHEKVRSPACAKHQKPLLNTRTERRDINETAGEISAGEHAMGIPYIDDDSS